MAKKRGCPFRSRRRDESAGRDAQNAKRKTARGKEARRRKEVSLALRKSGAATANDQKTEGKGHGAIRGGLLS